MDENQLKSEVKQYIETQIGCGEFTLSVFGQGVASINFRLQSRSIDYVVRCDFRRDLDVIKKDNDFILSAKHVGANVPSPYLNISKHNGYVITLRPYISGIDLYPLNPNLNNLDVILQAAGKQLQLIHSAVPPKEARRFFYNFIFDTTDNRWDEIRSYAFNHPDSEIVKISQFIEKFLRSDKNLFLDPVFLTKSLVHTDFTIENLILSVSNEIFVIDWEKSTIGSRLFDIALSLFYITCGSSAELRLDLGKNFLEGYRVKKMLSSEEIAKLKDAVRISSYAFYITDIVSAAKNLLGPNSSFSKRRENHFVKYCRPSFRNYFENFDLINSALDDWLSKD